MNYKIAAKGEANRLTADRHFPSYHAQETRNPAALSLVNKGRECAVDQGIREV
jgi:hypothetical protein